MTPVTTPSNDPSSEPRSAAPRADATAPAVGASVDLPGAVALLDAATTVTVLCHVQPDADTLGSGLALGLALERRGVAVQVAFAAPAEVPESMRSLPGGHLVTPAADGAPGRGSRGDRRLRQRRGASATCVTAWQVPRAPSSSTITCPTRGSGPTTSSMPDAEATAVVLADLFDEWGVVIDADLAHCLYAGLVTDTGSFRWGRPAAHLLAARLLATGIDGSAITRGLLDTHPFGWLPMLASVLASATLVPEAVRGRGLVYAFVRRADSAHLGSEEVESVIDIVRTTAEAEVAAVFKEVGTEVWTVSLRSKTAVDVSAAATDLGGGGHAFAAGYTAHGAPDSVVAALRGVLG